MLKGYGDFESTKEFIGKKSIKKASVNELYVLSAICCGTYLGIPNSEVDFEYKRALKKALIKGINLIDTAINYRGMRSEVLVGEVIKELIEEQQIKRSEIVIATKGGFLPADYRNREVGENYRDFMKNDIKEHFMKAISTNINLCHTTLKKILDRGNAVEKEIIECFFEISRENLGLETIDIYYLHNPEVSKKDLGEDSFYQELKITFELLEQKVKKGQLRYYGISTYSGFISNPDAHEHLSLERIVNIVETVAGKGHHLKFIQLPLNKAMNTAEVDKTQQVQGRWMSCLDAAKELNIKVMTNISLAQGKAFDKYSSEEMIEYLLENENVCASMIGMKKEANVDRNIRVLLK